MRADWAYGPVAKGPKMLDVEFDPIVNSCDHVPERNLGAFAGWPTANDWGWGIMHCCTGNATRALYYIWDHMLSYDQGTLSVNLLRNRPSRWADVHSHIPYAGQVDVAIKEPCALRVRIPEWTQPGDVSCTVNGQARPLDWDGRFAVVGETRAKDLVSVSFPIAERTVEVSIEKHVYTLILRGNEVIKISPPGQCCPLYQRDHYRQDDVRWRKMTRFLADEQIFW